MRFFTEKFSALNLLPIGVTIGSVWFTLQFSVQAQIVPDRSLGENSVVVPNQNIRGILSDRIDGGAVRGGNLFHSFQEFNVDEGRGAYFSNPDNIINILTRVTGGNISEIMGTLGVLGNANFFLINPNGIVFGPNARLDVGGSFFASTADGILFENGIEFAASNPEAPPLLTINLPMGLNFRENPGSIVNQSVASVNNNNPVGLQVEPGKTLGLIGGDIRLESGLIKSPGSRIELGGLSGSGVVQLNLEPSIPTLGFPAGINRSDISLAESAEVNVRAGGGGSIAINAQNFEVSNDSKLRAGIETGQGSIGSQSGNIEINSLGLVRLSGTSLIANTVQENGIGNSGDVIINVRDLQIFEGSALANFTLGLGNGGLVSVQATNSVDINDGLIFGGTDPTAVGQGGNIDITTGSLFATNNSQINASSLGQGDAGNITINASGMMTLDQSSSIISNIGEGAIGNAGNITLITNTLQMLNGSQVSSFPDGVGNGGLITVQATGFVELSGENTALFGGTNPTAVGQGGRVQVTANSLTIREGAEINTTTLGIGDAGAVNLQINDFILLDNGDIFAGAASGSPGKAGEIDITASSLSLTNNSRITAFSSGSGNAGNITVNTRDFVALDNDSELSVLASGTGAAGNIFITTGQLFVQDGSSLSANVTGGNQPAGNIVINATETLEVAGSNQDIPGVFFGSRLSASNTANGNAGNLSITTQKLTVRDGANLLAAALGNAATPGTISIQATESVEIFGTTPDGITSSSIGAETIAEEETTGATANIIITTDQLIIRDGSRIAALTFGNSPGGIIEINASEFVEVSGTRPIGSSPSAIDTEAGGTGRAGDITITTDQLMVRDGGQVTASTSSDGQGGTLRVNARLVELVGSTPGPLSELSTRTLGNGNAGNLTVEAQQLILRDGAIISAETLGRGQGGRLEINASDSVNLTGTANLRPSTLTTVSRGSGDAGILTIHTPQLTVQDGASISASTTASGQGGTLTINATEIELSGTSLQGRPSLIEASVNTPEATGIGGNLEINTDHLSIDEGARISTATEGIGQAGNVIIDAMTANIQGTSTDSETQSGIFANTTLGSEGAGGNLTLSTTQLNVTDFGQISVSSAGTGAAGNLNVNSPFVQLDTQGSLRAETAAGDQGNIILNTSDLRLRNNSNITTNATGEATGGNIIINTETLTALEDSDISANAQQSFGGRIIVNAVGIFGTTFREQQTRFSDITATSELGPEFSGTVELNTELDPSSALIELPQTVVDPNDLIAQEFCRQRRGSEFVITGKGGLAVDPMDKADGSQINVDLVEPAPSQPQNPSQKHSETEENQPISSLDVIPARGWIRDENGDVILVGYDPTKTGVQRQPAQLPLCQP